MRPSHTGTAVRDTSPRALLAVLGRAVRVLAHKDILIRAGAVLVAISVISVALTVWGLRGIAVADALSNTENLAIVLAAQTSRSIEAADVVLREIQENVVASAVWRPRSSSARRCKRTSIASRPCAVALSDCHRSTTLPWWAPMGIG